MWRAQGGGCSGGGEDQSLTGLSRLTGMAVALARLTG
jgi:hypothetical protein